MNYYAGYIKNWNILKNIVDLKWLFVDGTHGLAIFALEDGKLSDAIKTIGRKHIYKLWLIEGYNVSHDTFDGESYSILWEQTMGDESGECLGENFHPAALQFPKKGSNKELDSGSLFARWFPIRQVI